MTLGMASLFNASAQDKKTATETKPETKSETVKITIETTKGTIELELDGAAAPISTKNFVSYVKKGHFDNTIFHRVIPNFMIQGGGFTADMNQKPTDAPIKNEATNGLKNVRGAICMARTSVVDSATSQFFINVKDNDFLNNGARDFGYAVFATVVKGMDIVKTILAKPTGGPGYAPGMKGEILLTPVAILSMTRTV